MSKSDDLEKIDIPWKLIIGLSVLAMALVMAYPTFNWIAFRVLQFKLESLAIKKAEELELASVEEALSSVEAKGYPAIVDPVSGTSEANNITYLLSNICSQGPCSEASGIKSPVLISLPKDLPEADLQSWANRSCIELHAGNHTAAAGAIIKDGARPIALLCAVSRNGR